jgi:hypothetical protein
MSPYWAATTYADNLSTAPVLNSWAGAITWNRKDWGYGARCVRNSGTNPALLIIGQQPMSGPAGTVFTQTGTGFTPFTTATIYVRKPDGTEYPPILQAIDPDGKFNVEYPSESDKPPGTYTWWAVDGTSQQKSNEVSYEITECDPPLHVNPYNSDAYALYEGLVENVTLSGDSGTAADFVIRATEIKNLPFTGKGVQFWMSIDNIDFRPDRVSIDPNEADIVGATFAELRLVPPGSHAAFRGNFCKSETVTFELGLNNTAIILTVADATISFILRDVLKEIRPDRVLAFVDELNNIPLMASCVAHIGNAFDMALDGNLSGAISELYKAKKDEISLYRNAKQRKQLLDAYKNLGIKITMGKLLKESIQAPIRVFEIFADVIVLGVQTDWGVSGLPRIQILGY